MLQCHEPLWNHLPAAPQLLQALQPHQVWAPCRGEGREQHTPEGRELSPPNPNPSGSARGAV